MRIRFHQSLDDLKEKLLVMAGMAEQAIQRATEAYRTRDTSICDLVMHGELAINKLEREIDQLNAELEPLTSFVLPGGSPAAAALHLARTVCRRAERTAVQLSLGDGQPVTAPALKYLNRLSDLLFVAARWSNARGADDVLWTPGGTR